MKNKNNLLSRHGQHQPVTSGEPQYQYNSRAATRCHPLSALRRSRRPSPSSPRRVAQSTRSIRDARSMTASRIPLDRRQTVEDALPHVSAGHARPFSLSSGPLSPSEMAMRVMIDSVRFLLVLSQPSSDPAVSLVLLQLPQRLEVRS